MRTVTIRAAMLLALGGPAAAQGSATPAASTAPPPAKARWIADYGDRTCSILRQTANDAGRWFAIRSVPGASQVEVIFEGDLPSAGRAETGTLRLLPEDRAIDGRLTRYPRAPKSTAFDSDRLGLLVPRDWLERIGKVQRMAVWTGKRQLTEASVSGLAKAVVVLRDCERNSLKELGVDLDAQSRIAEHADVKGGIGRLVDYPAMAQLNNEQGRTTMRFVVDTEGRVTACDRLVITGASVLDRVGCGPFLKARFTPARDASGIAIAEVRTITLLYELR